MAQLPKSIDVLTPEQRHRCMSHIRSSNTRPERIVRHFLFACGMRFRKNVKALPGTPDIVLRKYVRTSHQSCASVTLWRYHPVGLPRFEISYTPKPQWLCSSQD